MYTTPPHSLEAEEGVLGSVFVDNTIIDVCREMLQSEDFWHGPARMVYEAMLIASQKSRPIDMITIQECMTVRGTLEPAGGLEYLSHLVDATPSASRAEYYAEIVREKSAVRETIRAAQVIVQEAQEGIEDVETWLAGAQQRIGDATQRRAVEATPATWSRKLGCTM